MTVISIDHNLSIEDKVLEINISMFHKIRYQEFGKAITKIEIQYICLKKNH